jgi:hypothetical protein
MKCKLCGEAITNGDEVIGIVRGNMEGDDAIDVQKTVYVHFSCYRDAKVEVYPEI